jgi:IclR family transcriptional regulator, acetate operon repressor
MNRILGEKGHTVAATTSDHAPAYPLHSVAKALELLLLLRDQDRISVAEASRQLGVARSTAHRLVSMLEYYGFTQRDHKARHYPGPALIGLGLAAVVRLDIRQRARKHMQALAEEVGETVTLMSLEGPTVRFLYCVESAQPIRVAGRAGLVRPAHCTSAGKAILAAMPREEFDRLYPSEQLEVLTDDSIATRTALLAELEKVRRRGFATNIGESDAGLRAVGVAIPEVVGAPSAGLGVSAPASRLTKKVMEAVAAATNRAASAIAESPNVLSD